MNNKNFYFVPWYEANFDIISCGGILVDKPVPGSIFMEKSPNGDFFFQKSGVSGKWFRVSREWGLANPLRVGRFYPILGG